MGSVEISVEELTRVADEFQHDFGFTEMDLKMHRFPAGLGRLDDKYISPTVVAIGPYHHGSRQLQKMEEVKCAAAYYLSLRVDKPPKEMYKAVCSVAVRARKRYADDAMVGSEDAEFPLMMFRDACFLLLYMDASSRCYGRDEDYAVNPSLRRFFFSNRGSIGNDIMLLENQLPWLVVTALIDSLSPEKRSTLMEAVGKFIAGFGNSFKINEDVKKEPFVWDEYVGRPPPHLLGLLRRHKTEPGSQVNWPQQLNHISASSATELAEIGINLTVSKTAAFTDMNVKKKGPLCGELSLAPLSLNDTRACCLVNMAAFEVCTASRYGDDPNSTAICSYLALFAMFMVREEDVHELRSKRILHGHHTNKEMLAFFKGVMNHLPSSGCRFANIMAHIKDYKKKRCMQTNVHRFFYNHCKGIVELLTLIGVLGGIFQLLLSLNQGQNQMNGGRNLPFLPS